jgi:anti-sigma regulatory factor (Ser/Thr protein kinase)
LSLLPQGNRAEGDSLMSVSSDEQSIAVPWPLSSTLVPLAALPTASACARGHVESVLACWQMAELVEAAELVTSELVTNAVNASIREFGSPPYRDQQMAIIRLRLSSDWAHLLIEVWDMAAAPPIVRQTDTDDECGRGLQLVDALTDRWGWHRIDGHPDKCVWAELRLET